MNRDSAIGFGSVQPHGHQPTRRGVLRAGAAGSLGLVLGEGFRPTRAQAVPSTLDGRTGRKDPPAQSVILVFLEGGLSQVDSFDPKPNAPTEIRGEFRAIRTNADGVLVSELWPRVASVADKITFIRSVTHGEAVHERGCRRMLTDLLAATGADVNDGGFAIRNVPRPLANHGHARFTGRPVLPEPDSIRETYGRNPFGQRLLMARRLVEAGRPFVSVSLNGWDMHADVHAGMRATVPAVDRAVAALIRDLDDRGLLQSTLVVLSTEFGRTPRINKDGGRDHWPNVFTVALAGGGITGGRVIGASTADGMEPRDIPVRPADLMASVSRQLGIATDRELIAGLA